jgi:hypothetical protein
MGGSFLSIRNNVLDIHIKQDNLHLCRIIYQLLHNMRGEFVLATKNVTYDFFTFKNKNNQNILKQTLEKEYKLRQSKKVNNIKLYDYYARIREIEYQQFDFNNQDSGYWLCNIEKINVLDEASIGDLQGGRQTIATGDDQGPIIDTVFLYNPFNDVIVLQRNRSGLSLNSFTLFLSKLTNSNDIELELIIDPNALEKLKKMPIVDRIEYKISKPTSYKFAKNEDRSLRGDIKLAELFQGENLKVVIGAQRGGHLHKTKILSKVKSLLRNSDGLHKLNVRGRVNGDIEILDLIKQRILFTKKFNLKRGEKVTLVKLQDAIIEAYKFHSQTLDNMYINKKL